MQKNKKKWLIGSILTILSMALCLYVAIEVIVASNQNHPPRFFGVSISYVPTDSMVDTIQPGEYVLFTKVDAEDVQVGDIIVYRSKEGPMAGNYIIHRVIEMKDGYFVTKGDHNPVADEEKITPDMVHGRFVCVLGFLSLFNRNVIFVFLFIVFLLFVVLQAVSVYLKYQKEKIKSDNKQIDLEKLKKEILEEELEKLKNEKNIDS